ncbi:sigma-54 dependent transcriptional regulator [Verrucomicrobia bacterium]|nr:sigma-54 dependent transcriptional regulator [Verrucomicrobiota bacterium]
MDKILLIDDEPDVHYSFKRTFANENIEFVTASSGEEGIKTIPTTVPDLVIMDVRMGGINGLETLRRIREFDRKLPVIIMTAFGTTQTAIEAMKLGAHDYLLKPFNIDKLKEIVHGALKASKDMRKVVSYQPLLEREDYDMGVVGKSPAMQEVFKLIGQVSTTDATCLITGKSGTGKELVARAIYHHGQRAEQRFIAINCAAIPEALLESELFGHEKGAFTGATVQKIGKFEQCDGGTIFLDEIGDMSLPTQTKILRVLQSGTIDRVGGNAPINVNVRIIAATNKPLEKAVQDKEFREDLFYRLNVVRIRLPSLKERKGDIPLLVNYFLQNIAKRNREQPKGLHLDVLKILKNHDWPGNVRELENVIQRSIVVAKGNAVLPSDLPRELNEPLSLLATSKTINDGGESPNRESDIAGIAALLFERAKRNPDFAILPAVERELIIHALNDTEGNQVKAAKLLGITRATLRKRIEKFEIQSSLSIN